VQPEQATAGREYLDAIRKILGHDNAVQDLRIPAVVDYQDALESRLSWALAGRTDPASALADAAKAWNDITDRVGRDEQLNHYRKSLGAELAVRQFVSAGYLGRPRAVGRVSKNVHRHQPEDGPRAA